MFLLIRECSSDTSILRGKGRISGGKNSRNFLQDMKGSSFENDSGTGEAGMDSEKVFIRAND